METAVIIAIGLMILATQWYNIWLYRKNSIQAAKRANQLTMLIHRSGVARQARIQTNQSNVSTPIVDSNPRERRRNG